MDFWVVARGSLAKSKNHLYRLSSFVKWSWIASSTDESAMADGKMEQRKQIEKESKSIQNGQE